MIELETAETTLQIVKTELATKKLELDSKTKQMNLQEDILNLQKQKLLENQLLMSLLLLFKPKRIKFIILQNIILYLLSFILKRELFLLLCYYQYLLIFIYKKELCFCYNIIISICYYSYSNTQVHNLPMLYINFLLFNNGNFFSSQLFFYHVVTRVTLHNIIMCSCCIDTSSRVKLHLQVFIFNRNYVFF